MSARLILLSADDHSIEAVKGVALPSLELVVFSWDSPSAEAAASLRQGTLVDLSLSIPPWRERLLDMVGITALTALLNRTAPGRLLASVSPAHRSRLFAARVKGSGRWKPTAGDSVIALDLTASRTAWLAARASVRVTATLGLGAGLSRLIDDRQSED